MNLNEQELQCLRDGILAAFNQRPITVWVVGSFAVGQEIRSSDLDVMIQAPQALTLTEAAALRAWFDASDLPYVVDLVDYHQVVPRRRADMLRGAQKIIALRADEA